MFVLPVGTKAPMKLWLPRLYLLGSAESVCTYEQKCKQQLHYTHKHSTQIHMVLTSAIL